MINSIKDQEIVLKRSDFIISPFLKRSNTVAAWQILSTFIPIYILWLIINKICHSSIPIGIKGVELIPILTLLILLSSRSFSLMHDCGHGSLFESAWLNRLVAFPLGVLNAIPQYNWSRDHAFHHQHNGNWEIYKGPIDVITLRDYKEMTLKERAFYKLSRHWTMLFPGGFYYLIIKPRITLIIGLIKFSGYFINQITKLTSKRIFQLSSYNYIISKYRSEYWISSKEFYEMLANNIVVVTLWILMSRWMGAGTFWSLYSIIMTFSAAIFICVFFVQHNFEGSYANGTSDWNLTKGAIDGSSNLDIPRWLDWFLADISFHSIHHLCDRIPNYNLRACHNTNKHLLTNSKFLKIKDIPSCFKYIIWDSDSNSLTNSSDIM